MSLKKIKGFVLAAAIPYLLIPLIAAGGYQVYKILSPGRNKDNADKAAAAAVDTYKKTEGVAETAKAVTVATDTLIDTHKKQIATRDQMDKNSAGFSSMAIGVLEGDNSEEAQLAKELSQSAIDALGIDFTPAESAKYAKLSKGILQKNIALTKQVQQMKEDSIALVATNKQLEIRSTTAETNAKSLTTELTKKTSDLTVTSKVAAKLTVENKNWADNEYSLWDKIKALGWLAVILAAIAVLLGIKFLGVKETATDTVALLEEVKRIAIAGGHDAAELESKIHTWWENDKNENKVAAIKSKILRQ